MHGELGTLRRFADVPGAWFISYEALDGGCPPRGIGLLGALEQITQWFDGDPLEYGVADGAQDPLPGLDTPPCQ